MPPSPASAAAEDAGPCGFVDAKALAWLREEDGVGSRGSVRPAVAARGGCLHLLAFATGARVRCFGFYRGAVEAGAGARVAFSHSEAAHVTCIQFLRVEAGSKSQWLLCVGTEAGRVTFLSEGGRILHSAPTGDVKGSRDPGAVLRIHAQGGVMTVAHRGARVAIIPLDDVAHMVRREREARGPRRTPERLRFAMCDLSDAVGPDVTDAVPVGPATPTLEARILSAKGESAGGPNPNGWGLAMLVASGGGNACLASVRVAPGASSGDGKRGGVPAAFLQLAKRGIAGPPRAVAGLLLRTLRGQTEDGGLGSTDAASLSLSTDDVAAAFVDPKRIVASLEPAPSTPNVVACPDGLGRVLILHAMGGGTRMAVASVLKGYRDATVAWLGGGRLAVHAPRRGRIDVWGPSGEGGVGWGEGPLVRRACAAGARMAAASVPAGEDASGAFIVSEASAEDGGKVAITNIH